MFGKAAFNHTLFNRSSGATSANAKIHSDFTLDSPNLFLRIDLGEVFFRPAFSLDNPTLAAKVPLPLTEIHSDFSVYANAGLYISLQMAPIESTFEVGYLTLRVEDAEELNLSDLGFLPGDTLIIDTDQIDVQLNGETEVESWVSGSVFVQLKPGTDVIEIFTDPSSITLEVTIIWSDRYL